MKCQQLKPKITELATRATAKLAFHDISDDANRVRAETLGVRALPHIIITHGDNLMVFAGERANLPVIRKHMSTLATDEQRNRI